MKHTSVLAMSKEELDRLAEILETFPGPDAMNLEELDGFFAAVICSPKMISPSEYLPQVWGGESLAELVFAEKAEKDEFFGLAIRHWCDMLGRLESDEAFEPLLLGNEEGHVTANDWARGFARGVGMSSMGWEDAHEDGELAAALITVVALAHEHDPDPELRPFPEPLTAEKRLALIESLAEAVPVLYDYFKPRRELTADLGRDRADAWYDEPITCRREGPKIGRNEPCPCGSGKKYKRCCGAGGG